MPSIGANVKPRALPSYVEWPCVPGRGTQRVRLCSSMSGRVPRKEKSGGHPPLRPRTTWADLEDGFFFDVDSAGFGASGLGDVPGSGTGYGYDPSRSRLAVIGGYRGGLLENFTGRIVGLSHM